MIRNEKMRDALKELESTVTATLAHQPEDDEKCGQFLYDALIKVHNIADLACHKARGERDGANDMERLKVACEECHKAISAVLEHESARKQNVRWRFEHLQLELYSFRIVMWPDLPQTKKTNQ